MTGLKHEEGCQSGRHMCIATFCTIRRKSAKKKSAEPLSRKKREAGNAVGRGEKVVCDYESELRLGRKHAKERWR